MEAEANKAGNKYEWQSWPPDSLDGMPPKRKRLVVWGLWWFFLLGTVLATALDAANLQQPWGTVLILAGLVAVFGPLIRGSVLETRKLRAEGIVLPSASVTRKSLISMAVITAVLWGGFAFLVATGRPAFPLLPTIGTIWLAYQFRQLRSRSRQG